MPNKLFVNFEVESDFIETRTGVNAKNKPYELNSQKVWAYLNSKFPKEIQIMHDDKRNALKPGLYHADLRQALDVGDFGKLIIDGRRLSLLAGAAPVAVLVKA